VWGKVVGGKMEEVKKVFSFTFHWPLSLEPSIGHQALDPPSPSFSFFLKGNSDHWELSLGLEDNFHAILNTCFTSFSKRKIMFSLSGGKREER
jgi:hypothetical protein